MCLREVQKWLCDTHTNTHTHSMGHKNLKKNCKRKSMRSAHKQMSSHLKAAIVTI